MKKLCIGAEGKGAEKVEDMFVNLLHQLLGYWSCQCYYDHLHTQVSPCWHSVDGCLYHGLE
jgi:hypothetical protein